MHKTVATHDALLATLAKGHAINRAQIAITASIGCTLHLELVRDLDNVMQALIVGRMGRAPVGHLLHGLAFGARSIGGKHFLILQHANNLDHAFGVIAITRQIGGA